MSTTDPTNNTTAAVPGVPVEAPAGHEYIVVDGLGGPWLAEVTDEYPEPSPIGLIDDLLRASAALPSLREVIAAEVLAPVRKFATANLSTIDYLNRAAADPVYEDDAPAAAHLRSRAGGMEDVVDRLGGLLDRLSAPVQAAEEVGGDDD